MNAVTETVAVITMTHDEARAVADALDHMFLEDHPELLALLGVIRELID